MAIATTSLAGDGVSRQLDLLRFSEELHGVLARCGDECGVWAAAVHRTVTAFDARAGCLALYDAVWGGSMWSRTREVRRSGPCLCSLVP